MTPPDDPPPMDQPTPAEQLAAAEKAVSDAEAAVANAATAADRAAAYTQLAQAEQALAAAKALPDNVLADLRQRLADAESDLDDASTAATNLRNAVDAINAARTAADGLGDDADQDAIDTARTLVTAAQTAVDALDTDDSARLQSQLDDVDNTVTTAQTALDNAAMVAAGTKAAGTKRTAIATEAAQSATGTPGTDGAGGADAGLGGSSAPAPTTGQAAGEYNLAIKRDRTATTVTITVEGATEDDNETFELDMDLGHGRTMHTRTQETDDDGNTEVEVVVVSTDIEAPKATAFGMVHELDIRVDGETATTENPNDALAVTTANLAHVKASAFVAPAGTVTTVLSFQQAVEDDASTTDVDESRDAAEIMGTYEGAMGTFKCNATAAACTVTVNAMGVVSALSTDTDWIFIPADGATVDVADTDYLHYGFWLKRTTDSDGAITYNEVETFAGSSLDATATANLDDVTGSATYSGGATGVYEHNVTNPDGTEKSATSGQFTATANLTATFGQTVNDTNTPNVDEAGQIPPNMLNTVTGTISNFVLEHGEANDWSVSLDGDRASGENTFSGSANGGGEAGTFSGTFHGEAAETESTGDGTTRIAPSTVVGEFNANFSNGSVAGAFGARKQ